MFHVYILQNPQGKFYVGHTGDLQTRLQIAQRHGRDPWQIHPQEWPLGVWSEEHPDRSSAMARERFINCALDETWVGLRRIVAVLR